MYILDYLGTNGGSEMLNKILMKICSLVVALLFLAGCKNAYDPGRDEGDADKNDLTKASIDVTSKTDDKGSIDDPSVTATTTSEEDVQKPTSHGPSANQGISFRLGANIRVYDKDTDTFTGRSLTTKGDLDKLKLDNSYSISDYSDDYFSDHALLFLCITLESGSMQLQIDNITLHDDTLEVQYTSTSDGAMTADMNYRRVLLEVNKDDVKSVRQIIGVRNRVQTPSTHRPSNSE